METHKVFTPSSKTSAKDNTPVVQIKSTDKQFIDLIRENGQLVSGSNAGFASDYTLYTVPAGKVLYLVSATCYLWSTGAAQSYGGILAKNNYLIFLESWAINGANAATSINPVIPVKLQEGEKVILRSGAVSCLISGSFFGYLLSSTFLNQ